MYQLVTSYTAFNGDVVIVRTKTRGCFAFVGNRNKRRPQGWATKLIDAANKRPEVAARLERMLERRGVPCSAVYHPENVEEVEAKLADEGGMAGKKRKKRIRRRLKRRDRRTTRRLRRARKRAKRGGVGGLRARAAVARIKKRRQRLKKRMKRNKLVPRKTRRASVAARSAANKPTGLDAHRTWRQTQRAARAAQQLADSTHDESVDAASSEFPQYDAELAPDAFEQPMLVDPVAPEQYDAQPVSAADDFVDDGYDDEYDADEPTSSGGAGLAIAAVAAAGLAYTLMS